MSERKPLTLEEVRHERVEIWKPVKGYEKSYIVSNFGNVMSIPREYKSKDGKVFYVDGKTLKKHDDTRGYDRVQLGKHKKERVHRIVANAFIPNPMNLSEVNHKDGNKKNNNVENLEWISHKGNVLHAVETGLFGDRSKKAPPEIVKAIREEYVPYDREHSTDALAKKYGMSASYVWRIINGGKRKRVK